MDVVSHSISCILCFRRKTEVVQPPKLPLPVPQKLHFNITAEVKKDIEEAEQSMNT